MSLKDRIKNHKRKGVPLDIPEWGETVHLRQLSAREVLDLRAWIKEQEEGSADEVEKSIEILVRVTALSVVDEKGELVFGTEIDGVFYLDDMDKVLLESTDPAAMKRIFEHVMGQNGQSEKAREEIRKNSDPAACSSPAASPLPSEPKARPDSLDGSAPTTWPSGKSTTSSSRGDRYGTTCVPA